MRFVDEAVITIVSGNGGRGAVSFRREKYIPKGGPDGGDGGDGGDVIFESSHNITSLLDLKYKPVYAAENGGNGQGNNKKGRDGDDIVIKVPVGTVITSAGSGDVLADLVKDGEKLTILKGGRGGKGNTFFKSSVNRRPRFSQPGIPGEKMKVILILKSLGDVGIIGLPNAGKSTLISKLSSSHPEIAPYPFTTKIPNLGVYFDEKNDKTFTVVDIPGIIEGASSGMGLGIRFLKHIERSDTLLHLIEIGSPSEVSKRFETVTLEIKEFNPEILKKNQVVVINKIDLIEDKKKLAGLKSSITRYFKKKNLRPVFISAMDNKGINTLKARLKKIIVKKADIDIR